MSKLRRDIYYLIVSLSANSPIDETGGYYFTIDLLSVDVYVIQSVGKSV